MKKLLLLLILLSGCTTYPEYCGVRQPISPTPVYPPMYDVQPLTCLIKKTQNEALEFEEFVNQSGQNMLKLRWALQAYKYAARDLYYEIATAPSATVFYAPWKVEN